MAEISGISLYDANKQITANDKPLTRTEAIKDIRLNIKPFILNSDNRYFMLLCREQYDFTLFNFYNKENDTMKTLIEDIYECLDNRGLIMSILPTEDNDAIEIWLKIEDEVFVYYFFPYDLGVLEEGV